MYVMNAGSIDTVSSDVGAIILIIQAGMCFKTARPIQLHMEVITATQALVLCLIIGLLGTSNSGLMACMACCPELPDTIT